MKPNPERPRTENLSLVLVVEDVPTDQDLLRAILEPDVDVLVAGDAEEAAGVLQHGRRPDLIILDICMPGTDGYALCRSLKARPDTSSIPVIFVTALQETGHEVEGFEAGAVDYITKPFSPAIVQIRVQHQLELHDRQRTMRQRMDRARHELRASELKLIECLGRAAQFKDDSSGDHVHRMRHYVLLLARHAGLSPAESERLGWASTMHDIGMIGVPDEIVTRNGPLSAREEALMRQHVEIGEVLIGGIGQGILTLAEEVIHSHHEHWNGTGYPEGLSGSAIPISGRIVAIADVFDSLTAPRAWRRAWPPAHAFDFITEHAGSHFDPELAAHFVSERSDVLAIMARYPATTV